MKKIKVGIVGFGFIGPHHLDALRRTGMAEVSAIAALPESEAKKQAELHGIPKAYGKWQDLVADPDIEVVDIAAPTCLHAPIAEAAARAGKHVIVDKPMAMSLAEAESMHRTAIASGIVHAVTFSIRYNVMVQQARQMVQKGEIGKVHFVHGHYYQEWLLRETDYNWRIEPEIGGRLAMVADAGAHWYDMVQHVTGLKITRLMADLPQFMCIRQKPDPSGASTPFDVQTPDLGIVVMEFDNGARGMFATGAMHAGHKNDLTFEINGSEASIRWQQEDPNRLWIGRREQPNQVLTKDPALLYPEAAQYARLPGGHNEAWADAFRNIMGNILSAIRDGESQPGGSSGDYPTFATGEEICRVVDAIERSHANGGVWTSV